MYDYFTQIKLFVQRHLHRSCATQHLILLPIREKMFKPVRSIDYYFIYLYVNLLDS